MLQSKADCRLYVWKVNEQSAATMPYSHIAYDFALYKTMVQKEVYFFIRM